MGTTDELAVEVFREGGDTEKKSLFVPLDRFVYIFPTEQNLNDVEQKQYLRLS